MVILIALFLLLVAAPAKLTFDFPIWEVLATVVVTAAVTWLTIYVSVRQAQKQTDRSLEQAKSDAERAYAQARELAAISRRDAEERELRGAISALAAESNMLFMLGEYKETMVTITSAMAIVGSSRPSGDTAANWARVLTNAHIHWNTRERQAPGVYEPPPVFWSIGDGPAAEIAMLLSSWVKSDEDQGPFFTEQAERLNRWINHPPLKGEAES